MSNSKRLKYLLAGALALVMASATTEVVAANNAIATVQPSKAEIAKAKADAAKAVKERKTSYRVALSNLKSQYKSSEIAKAAYLKQVKTEKQQYSKDVDKIYLTMQKAIRGKPVSPN